MQKQPIMGNKLKNGHFFTQIPTIPLDRDSELRLGCLQHHCEGRTRMQACWNWTFSHLCKTSPRTSRFHHNYISVHHQLYPPVTVAQSTTESFDTLNSYSSLLINTTESEIIVQRQAVQGPRLKFCQNSVHDKFKAILEMGRYHLLA